jgi:hypothetical protein
MIPTVSASSVPSANTLLEGLVGETIHTPRGAPNTILGLTDDHVLVATERTPSGEPVRIDLVQHGLDLLARDRDVAIDRDMFERRSAFVGAVLLTLPGTRVTGAAPPHVVLEAPSASDWHLNPGETIVRSELHDIYGGSRQGGTSPSRRSLNIFLFLDRKVAKLHGYFDGWVGDRFYYTGHGQKGDQEFRAGNADVRRHREDGRAIRVFRGAGGLVRYLGEFELDVELPYFRMDAPESETGQPRQVIVFRLNPIGSVIHDPEDDLELPGGMSAPALMRSSRARPRHHRSFAYRSSSRTLRRFRFRAAPTRTQRCGGSRRSCANTATTSSDRARL